MNRLMVTVKAEIPLAGMDDREMLCFFAKYYSVFYLQRYVPTIGYNEIERRNGRRYFTFYAYHTIPEDEYQKMCERLQKFMLDRKGWYVIEKCDICGEWALYG